MASTIIFQGWLWKDASGQSLVQWKRRYFAVLDCSPVKAEDDFDGPILRYFASPDKLHEEVRTGKPCHLGTVPLLDCRYVCRPDGSMWCERGAGGCCLGGGVGGGGVDWQYRHSLHL